MALNAGDRQKLAVAIRNKTISDSIADILDSASILAVQQDHIADPADGVTQDAEARSAINDILDALEAVGILATE